MINLQTRISRELHVQPGIDPRDTIEAIVGFLCSYLVSSKSTGFVLGISGGQDSSLCGRLGQLAVTRARESSESAAWPANTAPSFWALRLPYGRQVDEEDALLAIEFINPDHLATIDIKPAVDATAMATELATGLVISDFDRGNIKARQRMIVQYAVASAQRLLVLGTDHAAEAVTGFYTKHGDGACDITPMAGLTKRQGKQLLMALGAPPRLYEKVPTADLEDLNPLVPDELVLEMTYEQIDDYLEGKVVDPKVAERLQARYLSSAHKRSMPATRFSWSGDTSIEL